jgi:hypothetical protein
MMEKVDTMRMQDLENLETRTTSKTLRMMILVTCAALLAWTVAKFPHMFFMSYAMSA